MTDTSENEIVVELTTRHEAPLSEEQYSAVVLAVQEGRIYSVVTIHSGTDTGIFRATVEDILAGWALTRDEADECAFESPGRSFDFGDDFFESEEVDG